MLLAGIQAFCDAASGMPAKSMLASNFEAWKELYSCASWLGTDKYSA